MDLTASARKVLESNQSGEWTRASHFYVHQWLWDSCFIAIGLATYDPQRAAKELLSLLRGQWANGMVPHIVFSRDPGFWQDAQFWHSQDVDLAPTGVPTSGMTQPPMLAIAAQTVYEKLPKDEGKYFLAQILPKIIAFHEWIYRERDPEKTGLAVLVHPWESGLDNSPPWMDMLNRLPTPWWLGLGFYMGAERILNLFRVDAKQIPVGERETNLEAVKSARLSLHYRRLGYDSARILSDPIHVAQESLIFNCVLMRANKALSQLTKKAGITLPSELEERFKLAEGALEQLWDERQAQYFPRDFDTKKLIKVPAVTALLPLYSGAVSKARAAQLVELLKNEEKFWTPHPVPSTPVDSIYFDEDRYWRGPVWININWFLIQGLLQYGYKKEAAELLQKTLGLVEKAGFWEYFSTLTGRGHGSKDFSWTAALTLDLQRIGKEL